MPGTYHQILYHAVFSTKERVDWITPPIAKRLHPFLGGLIRGDGGVALQIGGVEDHVHIYFRWRPDKSISDLMRLVKAKSSMWVHKEFPKLGEFAWQEGYGLFSVSKSQEKRVVSYIERQPIHHRREDFKSELLRLLDAHEVKYEKRYVFE
ncbi:MAG: IS200/IS605 family transposase [Planctomycetota bacterium]|nr:IS200/IS605 family transposase [Planctomycetota bacterium]